MYKAIKDEKIIAINESGEFPCLVYDILVKDITHLSSEYVEVGGEFVLKTDEKAIAQEKQKRIDELKQLLADADYWGQKYLDGEYSSEEWEQKVAQRKSWRIEIRELEGEETDGLGTD